MTRLYWLKLKDDFFRQKEIKRLRMIAGGDTYTIIYLKLLLLSLSNNGEIYYDSIGDTFINELALELDEKPDNVDVTVKYLISKGMVIIENNETMVMNHLPEMIGTESDSAQRVRRHRSRKRELQCNTPPLLGNGGVTDCNNGVTQILDIDKEIEIDTDKDEELAESDPVVITMPTKESKDYGVRASETRLYLETYPLINILGELKIMRAWLIANPTKQKTYKGMPRFINGWLSRIEKPNDNGRKDVLPKWYEAPSEHEPAVFMTDEERREIIARMRQ